MSRPKNATWRKVVDRVEVPYARDSAGKPVTVLMDVLECGHRLRTPYIRHKIQDPGAATAQDLDNRICKTCERNAK